ncbi:class I SAM-dependent methyltransferase [Deinococcus ruber]|nr:methyltransferase domain-containing protein [Deinococcus ruber]
MQDYFNARSANYDQAELHHRVAHQLLQGGQLRSGQQVLDLATGTGLLALDAARHVGPHGQVTGIDVSPGMLAQARQKAAQAELPAVTFLLGDAERLSFADRTFDRVFSASALVLMRDVSAALEEWVRVLRPGGLLAFDGPDGQDFGLMGIVADAAQEIGLTLAFSQVTATPARCRALLTQAGLEVQDIQEVSEEQHVPLSAALLGWEYTLAHPACVELQQRPQEQVAVVREAYIAKLTALAEENGGDVRLRTTLHLAFGQRPAEP